MHISNVNIKMGISTYSGYFAHLAAQFTYTKYQFMCLSGGTGKHIVARTNSVVRNACRILQRANMYLCVRAQMCAQESEIL